MTKCLVLTGGTAKVGPYGVDKLQDLGYELIEVGPARSALHRKIRDVVEHRTGRPIDKTVRSVKKALDADIVLAFLEREALSAAWAKAHRLPPYGGKPLVMLSCWLADELRTMPSRDRRMVAARYSGVDLTLVWSSNQTDILVDAGFHPDQVAAINFGFAPGLFPRVNPDGRTGVVAIGSDRGRDYPTLFRGVDGTGINVDLYSGEGNLEGVPLPNEVTFRGRVPFHEYRRLVATAAIVAVPTRELAYPTGQTVALEAAATGACIILTDTIAMREYFSEETCVLVKPGDANAWRLALQRLCGDKDARVALGDRAATHVRAHFTYEQMWRQVDELLRFRGWVL